MGPLLRPFPSPLPPSLRASSSSSQMVSAQSVSSAREIDADAWEVDDYDVEDAAREQAAAARSKRRRISDDGFGVAGPSAASASAAFGGTRGAVISGLRRQDRAAKGRRRWG